MKMFGLVLSAAIGTTAMPAIAQEPTLEQVQSRLEALEREAATLRAQLHEMRRRQSAGAAAATAAAPARAHRETRADAGDTGFDPQAWDHAYVGVHAGYSRFRSQYRQNLGGIPDPQATSGYSFGAQLGRRWQSGRLVAGVELQATFPQVPDHDTSVPGVPFAGPAIELDQRWSGRVKGSIGFASGPFLGYALAGLDVTQLRLEQANINCSATACSVVGPAFVQRRSFVGSVLGLGAEIRLGDAYSLGLEATHSEFGRTFSGVNNYDVTSRTLLLRLQRTFP